MIYNKSIFIIFLFVLLPSVHSLFSYLGNISEPITPYQNNSKGDLFTSAVAISRDGFTMIIGASYTQTGKGNAYWYKMDKYSNPPQWIFQSNLTVPGIGGCYYGTAAALSANGLRAVIGSACWTGTSYVTYFERNDNLSPWYIVRTFNPPGLLSGDRFGYAIACNNDCSVIIIGTPWRNISPYSNSGVAYLCTPTNTVSYWLPTNCTLINNPGAANSMYFGTSVAVSSSGDSFIIGSQNFGGYVYERNYGTSLGYSYTRLLASSCDPNAPTGSSNYGTAVHISSDGNAVLVGNPVGGSVGAAIGRTLSHNRLPDPDIPGSYVWNCTQAIIGPSSCQGAYYCDSFLFGQLVRLDSTGLNAWITSANLAAYYYNRSRINETWKYIQPMRLPNPGLNMKDLGKTGDTDEAISVPVIGEKGDYFSSLLEGFGFAFYNPDRLLPSASPTATSSASSTATSSASSTATSSASSTATSSATSTATSTTTSTSSASGSASATNTATSTTGSSSSNTPSNSPTGSVSQTSSPSGNSTGPDSNSNNNTPDEPMSSGSIIGIAVAGAGILSIGSIIYILKFNQGMRVSIQRVLRGSNGNSGNGYGNNNNSSNKRMVRKSSGQVPKWSRQNSLTSPRPGSTRVLTSPFPTNINGMNGIPTTNITMIKIDPTNSIPTLSTTNPGFNGRNNNTNPNNLFQIRQTTIINSMSREI